MSDVEVSAWGRRGNRGSNSDPTPSPPKAFSNADYSKLCSAVEKLAFTQLGHMYDNFTADELRHLFVPEVYRNSFTQTYSVESDSKATGEVYIDLLRVLGKRELVFEDTRATCAPKKVTLRVTWNRNTLPDGFVTPSPIFGSQLSPVVGLRGIPPSELHERFLSTMTMMTQVAGEWAVVKWVLDRLQNTLRTPQQMRYVWPATYTLATVANYGAAEDLCNASARAGNNAPVPPEVLPYLKASYEVVARSVLLGADDAIAANYRSGQLRLVASDFELLVGQSNIEIGGC